jgi:DNA-binding MarR family transcriptional regulator
MDVRSSSRPTSGSPARPASPDAAEAASEAVEILEVLWQRGLDTAASSPVSTFQLRVLCVLDHEEGMNLRRLGRLLDSTASSVSRLCDRLEATGYVERRPSPVSRRELQLHLTAEGKALLAEVRARRERALRTVLDRMPAAARRDLVRGLEAFSSATLRGESPTGGGVDVPA